MEKKPSSRHSCREMRAQGKCVKCSQGWERQVRELKRRIDAIVAACEDPNEETLETIA